MVAALMSSLACAYGSAYDIRKEVLVSLHHCFDLVCDVVEIDCDGLLIMKVEALNTHLGILGGCFADPSTADVFLLFLLVLQREDAMFLLFLVNLILDDSIKV